MADQQDGAWAEPAPSLDEVVEAVLLSSRALVALSARSIAQAHGVTLPQFRMMVVLVTQQTNLTGLAAALDVAPSTATRMVDRLVTAGLVQRTVSEHSRRETVLAATAAGRRLVRQVTARRRRDLRAVVQRIDPERRLVVSEAMNEFARAADAVLGPGGPDPGPARVGDTGPRST